MTCCASRPDGWSHVRFPLKQFELQPETVCPSQVKLFDNLLQNAPLLLDIAGSGDEYSDYDPLDRHMPGEEFGSSEGRPCTIAAERG